MLAMRVSVSGSRSRKRPAASTSAAAASTLCPEKSSSSALSAEKSAAEGHQPELGQLGQVARVAQARLQRALRRVPVRLRYAPAVTYALQSAEETDANEFK